jgi:gluconate 5-dehydrogenase
METLQELFGLKGKTALVTGASSGLGVEFARALAVAGADVAIVARRKERLEEVAAEIEKLGVRCLPVAADLTDEAAMDAALASVEKELGGVDILVNNAGIAPFGRAEKQTREQWESALAVNVTVPFLLCQRAARGMIERGGGGRIINISSVMGHVASSIYPTVGYNASKGALSNLTRQLAVEWARHGITVNAIAPAWFPSEMNTDPRYGDVNPKYKEKMEALTPMGRLGRQGELMAAMVFLASPAASYVTGAILPVDGGWLDW